MKTIKHNVGSGGQRLGVFPDLDLVVAVTAGNYSDPDGWRPSLAVVRDIVLAGPRKR